MATTRWGATSLQVLLTTALNSLANASFSVASATYDNTVLLDTFADVELVLGTFGSAPSAGAYVALYLQESVDGTNFETAPTTTFTNQLLCTWPIDTATTAKRLVARNVQLPPTKFTVAAYNGTGQALNASGNTVKVLIYDAATT